VGCWLYEFHKTWDQCDLIKGPMFNTRYLDKLLALNTAKNTMKRDWTDIGERDCLKSKCNEMRLWRVHGLLRILRLMRSLRRNVGDWGIFMMWGVSW